MQNLASTFQTLVAVMGVSVHSWDKLATVLKPSRWVKHFPPQNGSRRHAVGTTRYTLSSPGWHWGGSCTWALVGLLQLAIPPAITSLWCGVPWCWAQLSKIESAAAYPWSLTCYFWPWLSKSPSPLPLQGNFLVPDQDPGKWSPFKSCFQEQLSSLHIPRRRQSVF